MTTMEIESKTGEEVAHPEGDGKKGWGEPLTLDTYGGVVRVEWEAESPVTAMALLPFFIEFLKEGGRFEKWVSDCPIKMTSPNAGSKADILGTYLLSALSGQNRYAQMTALRNDGVNPGLLGM